MDKERIDELNKVLSELVLNSNDVVYFLPSGNVRLRDVLVRARDIVELQDVKLRAAELENKLLRQYLKKCGVDELDVKVELTLSTLGLL